MTANKEKSHMDFADWLRATRFEYNLSMIELARISGVSQPTISRLETRVTQPTLQSALLICDSLDLTLGDLYQALTGKEPLPLLDRLTANYTSLNLDDLVPMVRGVHKEVTAVYEVIAQLLSWASQRYAQRSDSESRGNSYFTIGEIERLVRPDPIVTSTLRYPPFGAGDLLERYTADPVFTWTDTGAYIRQVRSERQSVQAEFGTASSRRSRTTLSRLETGSVESVKFADVLVLEELFGNAGEVVGMYWKSARLHAMLTGQRPTIHYSGELSLKNAPPQALDVIYTFITTWRWHQYLGLDEGLMQELKNAMST